MESTITVPCKRAVAGRRHQSPLNLWPAAALSLALFLFAFPGKAQVAASSAQAGTYAVPAIEAGTTASPAGQAPEQKRPGTITGTIVDTSGTAVVGAHIKLSREGESAEIEVLSLEDGQFSFPDVAPGPFQLTISAEGFATQTASGNLRAGENWPFPQIVLVVATNITQVRVELSPIELAQEQLKDQEKQRVLGIIPNYYVTYIPNAAPLSSRQKFQLAWKTTVDPVSFGLTGVIAGIEQAQDRYKGFGQGADGFAKRYGATYADFAIGTFIGGAILPSVLKQDPRYFYKGTGTKKSRVLYALANAVIAKGDNGHWQPNYSGIIGSLAAGGISNLYYPEKDRNGAALTFENALIGIGANAAANILQEFVIKRLTSNVPRTAPITP